MYESIYSKTIKYTYYYYWILTATWKVYMQKLEQSNNSRPKMCPPNANKNKQ